jgi:hypothetical protein
MTNQHSITPPPELVRQWSLESPDEHQPTVAYSMVGLLAAKAARWGADQELEACINYFYEYDRQRWGENSKLITGLRAARRPEPLSLKEQALEALGRFSANSHTTAHQMQNDFDLFRRALQSLDD